jgi:hypothetical protein
MILHSFARRKSKRDDRRGRSQPGRALSRSSCRRQEGGTERKPLPRDQGRRSRSARRRRCQRARGFSARIRRRCGLPGRRPIGRPIARQKSTAARLAPAKVGERPSASGRVGVASWIAGHDECDVHDASEAECSDGDRVAPTADRAVNQVKPTRPSRTGARTELRRSTGAASSSWLVGTRRWMKRTAPRLNDSAQWWQALAYMPMRKPGDPHEIDPIARYWASDQAGSVSGSTFVPDGGLLQSIAAHEKEDGRTGIYRALR